MSIEDCSAVQVAPVVPDVPVWKRPLCQTVSSLISKARMKALDRFGPCHVCGKPCDGSHSYENAPLFCDLCCPSCKPTVVGRGSYAVRPGSGE